MEETDHNMNEEETSPDLLGFNLRSANTSSDGSRFTEKVEVQPNLQLDWKSVPQTPRCESFECYWDAECKDKEEDSKLRIIPDEKCLKYDPTAWDYEMSGEKLLVILNHHSFKKTKAFSNKQPVTRTGTDNDVKNLKSLFDGLGFKVEDHKDLVYDEIINTLREVASRNHTRTSCICITILTHADEVGVLYAANRSYLLRDILTIFEKQPQLVHKPKLFLIQASKVKFIENLKTVHKDGELKLTVPTHTDFLILHSSVEEYVENENGSWMIQALCRILKKYRTKLDLLQMITLMNRGLVNTPSNEEMPETTFTLTKQLKF